MTSAMFGLSAGCSVVQLAMSWAIVSGHSCGTLQPATISDAMVNPIAIVPACSMLHVTLGSRCRGNGCPKKAWKGCWSDQGHTQFC